MTPGKPLVLMISGYRGLAEQLIADFSARGHELSVLVRNPDALKDLRAKYPKVEWVVGDLSSPETPARWWEITEKRFQKVDCLVNNAAIQGPGGLFHTMKWEEIEETITVDLIAPMRLLHETLNRFVKQNQGTIINLSGGGATAARPRFAPYAISKCALVRLTETLAAEYPALRFYAVAPGTMKTQMTESILSLGAEVAGSEFNPLKQKLDAGGDGTDRAAKLIGWLVEERPEKLSGKLVSAIWDKYQEVDSSLTELWTLRRVDQALIEKIAKISPHEK